MYVGKYDHGSLSNWIGSRTRADITYAQVCDGFMQHGARPTLVLRAYSEYKCTDDTCSYDPCYAASIQGDKPTIPPRYVK